MHATDLLKLTVAMRRRLIVSFVVAICVVVASTAPCRAEEDENITLKLERKAEFFLWPWGFNVFVNGERVSTVYNGQHETVTFPAAPDGKNWIKLGITDSRYPDDRSLTSGFIAYPGGVVLATLSTARPAGGDIGSIELRVEKKGKVPVHDVVVNLDKDSVDVVVSSEIVRTLPGTKRTVRRTRLVEHAVSVTDSNTIAGIGKVTLGVVSTQISGELEHQLNRSFKQSESVEQAIEIDGTLSPAVRLVWVERRQKGRATAKLNGTDVIIPFEFTLDVELRAELAE